MVLWKAEEPAIDVTVWEMLEEFLTGSLVMILIVPAMAEEPKSADPPPRITSTLSTILAGSCSMPYTPANALNIGRESIRIWVYWPSSPLILTCWNPQFWQLFSTRIPGWKASPWATVVAFVLLYVSIPTTFTRVGDILLVVSLRVAETITPSICTKSSSKVKFTSYDLPLRTFISRVWVLYPIADTSTVKLPSGMFRII